MTGEEANADEAAARVVAIDEECGYGLGVEAIGACAPRALQPETRRSGSLVLWPNPEGAFVCLQIALQRRERPRRNGPDGLGGGQRGRDLSDCSKPRRR